MRFGINAQRLTGQRLGVGRYIEYLLRNWATMLRPDESAAVYLRDPLDSEGLAYLQLSAAIQPVVLGPRLTGSLWEQLVLAGRNGEADVLFCPSYTAPLRYRGRTVVAVHSVNEAEKGAHPWWYDYTYAALYRRSAERGDMVVVPCETTRADLHRLYGIPLEKMVVVPQGADPSFRPLADEAMLAATRRRLLGEDVPYVLFVGKLSRRRNTLTLIEAFAGVKRRRGLPHRLLLVGPNHERLPIQQTAERLGVGDSVVQTDGRFRDHKELIAIYNAADVFVHPSSYEGWSMTTMEALACGAPVIAVNRGGLGELANGYAFMVQEPTAAALADALDTVLRDTALGDELRARSQERGRAFTWEDTARRTLEVIRHVAAAA